MRASIGASTLCRGMSATRRRRTLAWREERGQLAVYVVVMLVSLIGFTAIVVDFGSWFRDQRRLQAVADASALAGAQALPYDQNTATSLALSYAAKNHGPTPTIVFPAASQISVDLQNNAPGFFARVYGAFFDSALTHAHATAEAAPAVQASGVVPIVVTSTQPMLVNCSGPCFGPGYPTTLKVNDDATLKGGQMGLVDLTGNGSVTAQQITDWVANGVSSYLQPDAYYYSAGSCKFSNQSFHQALDAKVASAQPLLVPVYDPSLTDTSTNPPRYWIVGWAAFVITDYRLNGCGSKSDYVNGYFVRTIAKGRTDSNVSLPDYGVYVIQLVD
jgi:Flp pilus assembly protein TadG